AEDLFRQFQLLGKVAVSRGIVTSNNRSLARRIGIISGFFWILQDYAALELEEGEVLLYNTERWPDGAPPAGWSRSGETALPSHLIASYCAFWIGSGYKAPVGAPAGQSRRVAAAANQRSRGGDVLSLRASDQRDCAGGLRRGRGA